MTEAIDAEIVGEDTGDSPVTPPSRLSAATIGGLKIRRPDQALPYLNLMVYGDSGVGKTLLAGSAAFVAEMSPVLFVDVEGGTLTLGHYDNTADIDVIRVKTFMDIQKIYDDLVKGRHPYKTVVIDSLTELQKFGMASQLGSGKDFEPGGNMPEFKDWHINTEQIRRVVRGFRDLEINTIFTALSMQQAHPRNAAIELTKPAFTKKLAGEIPAFFDILFYYYVKSVKNGPNLRYLQTDKTDTVVAKCRVQGVPEQILNPTMDALYDLLIRNPSVVDGTIEVVQAANAASAGGMRKRAAK